VSAALEWHLLDRMRARVEIDNLLRAPWLTVGRLSSPLGKMSTWSSGLHSRFSLSASRSFGKGLSLELVFRRTERVEVEQLRGHALDLSHAAPLDWAATRADCWILRLRIHP
jgi:hypothetical protein